MEKFRKLFAASEIAAMVDKVAREVDAAYPPGEALVCVGVLKGAWMFHADLVRKLERPVLVDFIRAASYGQGTESTGLVRILKDIEIEIADKHVLLVEEIIDSGRTLAFIKQRLANAGAKSVKIAALLDKRERRVVPLEGDFIGSVVGNHFVVGYGLDWGERFRNLPDICAVEGETLR